MSFKINQDTIIEFLYDTLSQEKMSLVADAIVSNVDLINLYKKTRKEIITQYYVNKKLRTYDRINFEYKVKKSEYLLKEINIQKNINNSLKDLDFEETINEIYNEYASTKKHSIFDAHFINRNFNWLVAASISLFLILGSGATYLFQSGDVLENRLYKSYYTPYDYTDSYALNVNSFNIAKQKYLDGEYINALELFKGLSSSLSIEVERDFFIGLSLMEIGKFDSAIKCFEQLILSKNGFEYIPQIKWYMGLCYLKTRNKEKAIETFNDIVSNKEYNYKKAKRIVRKLNV